MPLGTVVYKMNHIDTGRVIDEVRIRRCLWDPADDFYKNKDAKNKAWEEIGKELCGENFNTDLGKKHLLIKSFLLHTCLPLVAQTKSSILH